MMASRSEELWSERLKSPESPSECNFSDVFFERNSDPQLKESIEGNVRMVENEREPHAPVGTKAVQPNTGGSGNESSESRKQQGDDAETTVQNNITTTEGTSVDVEDNLIDAIKQDRLYAVQKLLSEGCNPNEPVDMEGNRPLHWALFIQKAEYVRMLLEARVDVNLPGKQNATPIMVTPSLYRRDSSPWDIVHSLIQANCDINRVGGNSKSTLHMAVQLGNVNLVKILLHYNVDIDIKDSKGRSPYYVCRAAVWC